MIQKCGWETLFFIVRVLRHQRPQQEQGAGSGAGARAAGWEHLPLWEAEPGIAQTHGVWVFFPLFYLLRWWGVRDEEGGEGRVGAGRRGDKDRHPAGTCPGAVQHAGAFPYCCPKHLCRMESG